MPYASGVNNHMGSKFMADEEKLTLVFRELKKKNLFFIDSRTTRDSKTEAAAHKARLTVMSRKIFLDNERDTSKIYQILMEAARSSDGNSPLIVIGHPYPETIQAVREAGKVCREQGITIVPVSALLGKQGAS
ncbi:MAG: Divergent polysaccharide deacetylase [Candidatus Omnitrophica bacterium ADurb.Bin277]|nr:MAG: Divergent polysaccharide deacetylase [Candidatus Omnitrophica bacterium ADurb.Bin277]